MDRSPRSQALCSVTKLRLAAARKPSVSKPSGIPQFCEPVSAEPITTPPATAPPAICGRAASNAAPWLSQGRAEASLPTFSGLYWRATGASTGAPAPWNAKGAPPAAAGLRERMIMPITAKAARASKAISKILPNAAPRPSEWASHARPRPAAKPPSMAPQGFLGAAAGAGLAAGVAGLAAFCAVAFCVGAAGVEGGVLASRWVTLLDCLPMDLPPPMRRASASIWAIASMATRTTDHKFFMSISAFYKESRGIQPFST